jgi:HlyD family secretion protein
MNIRIGRAAAFVLVGALALAGCGKKTSKTAELQFAPVEKKTIEVTVEATGAVEPIDLIEVKSKASGQIVKMNVAVGSVVKSGDLLAQIDPRDVDNQYRQSAATMQAAQSSATIAAAQKKRADGLFAEGVITAPEHETADMANANAQAALVRARTDLDIARQRREDATVSAPANGTVLSQAVAVGQVIASATSSVSGGTTLLTMADLSRIRMRALVSESDIGNVRPGMPTTVTVDAFPNRSFQGTVEKIEPQAVIQQSVTMFPVLISLDNENGVLLPGMNGEVSVQVASHETRSRPARRGAQRARGRDGGDRARPRPEEDERRRAEAGHRDSRRAATRCRRAAAAGIAAGTRRRSRRSARAWRG